MSDFYLSHHGVKGMKWGVRKKSYVTVRQSLKNAKAASENARRDKIRELNDSPNKYTLRQRNIEANKASKAAYKDSIAKDKAYNKEQRANQTPEERKRQIRRNVVKGSIIAAGLIASAGFGARAIYELKNNEIGD